MGTIVLLGTCICVAISVNVNPSSSVEARLCRISNTRKVGLCCVCAMRSHFFHHDI